MLLWLTRTWQAIVRWFRPDDTAVASTPAVSSVPSAVTPIASTAVDPPLPQALPVADLPAPIIPSPPEPSFIEPRAKWIKPKGSELLRPRERPEKIATIPAAPRKPKAPRPALRRDESPEQWGQYYFRDAILDQLDKYFVYLKRMRHLDKDAYDLHRQLGIQIMPRSAVQAFDDWRSEGGMDELSKWWKDNRPGFGAISYGIDRDSLEEESFLVCDLPPESFPKRERELKRYKRVVTVTGGNSFKDEKTGEVCKPGIIWVPKFLYFHKYRRPPPTVQRASDGDVYSMTVYWDRVDGYSRAFEKRHKGGVPQDYAVCVERATGKVRVLNMLINERVHIRHTRGPDRGQMFSIPNRHWGVPSEHLSWACGRYDSSPEDYLRRCFIEAALMYESAAMGSMIRVEASRGSLCATFGVDVKRMSYFFKDRDVTVATLTERGTRRPIFHIVRPHMRQTKKGASAVRMHFAGLKEFEWAGYKIRITVPVLDHLALPEFGLGSDHANPGEKMPKGMATMEKYGEVLRDKLVQGAGAWKQPSETKNSQT